MGLMNYNDLVGARSKPGSLQNFVRHKRVPGEIVVEEAQTFIYSLLRVREMRASALLKVPEHGFTAALPTGFLEAIAMKDRDGTIVYPDNYVGEHRMLELRGHDADRVTALDGAISASALSLTVVSAQDFPSTGEFSIKLDNEVLLVTAGAGTATWTVTRGFAGTTAAAHADTAIVDGGLDSGTPVQVAIFDELFQFECRAEDDRYFDLAYYRTPDLLSPSNTTNFLTRRYPHLLRSALNFRAAAFMKDAEESAINEKELIELIGAVNVESDLGRAA